MVKWHNFCNSCYGCSYDIIHIEGCPRVDFGFKLARLPIKSVEEDESCNWLPITIGQARLGELGSNYYLSIGENRVLFVATRLLVIWWVALVENDRLILLKPMKGGGRRRKAKVGLIWVEESKTSLDMSGGEWKVTGSKLISVKHH